MSGPIEELENLANLRDQDIITAAAFDLQKTPILSGTAPILDAPYLEVRKSDSVMRPGWAAAGLVIATVSAGS